MIVLVILASVGMGITGAAPINLDKRFKLMKEQNKIEQVNEENDEEVEVTDITELI